jgi:GTPase
MTSSGTDRFSNDSGISESLAKIAIVGRPNVGKSSLFNMLTHTRKSVVKDQRGVTRDLIVESAELWGKNFDLIDTGGLTEAHDIFSKLIREQVGDFLHLADLIIVMMDGREGLVPEDRDVVRMVQETGRPFCLVINKLDKSTDQRVDESATMAEFYEFGVEPIPVSVEGRRNLAPLLEWIHSHLPEQQATLKEGMNLAVVGKPNAGKSSLVNQLLGENRMLVSPVAGTTVDAVDTPYVFNGKKYVLVDTAGLRKSRARTEDLEIIAAFKSQESIRRCDVVLLVIDVELGPSDQDARIMQAIIEDHKGVIIVGNKIDISNKSEEMRTRFREQVKSVFHFFDDVPIVFTSAQTGRGIGDLLNKVEWISGKLEQRISTSELNDFFFEVIRKAPAPVYGQTNVKFYYLTQTRQKPPSFIAFANHPDGVDNSYRRFLMKNIKLKFDLVGVPVRIFAMKSRGSGKER